MGSCYRCDPGTEEPLLFEPGDREHCNSEHMGRAEQLTGWGSPKPQEFLFLQSLKPTAEEKLNNLSCGEAKFWEVFAIGEWVELYSVPETGVELKQ